MLKINPFKQSKGFCGPASLKMVLKYFGMNHSEKELAKLSGCKISMGVEAEGLLKAAKKLGFNGLIKDYAEIKDIRNYVIKKKMPVIVDWFSTDEGHYSVVVDIDKKHIYLMDPEIKKMRRLKLDTFKRVWFDFTGPYLKSRNNVFIRRMLVIYK